MAMEPKESTRKPEDIAKDNGKPENTAQAAREDGGSEKGPERKDDNPFAGIIGKRDKGRTIVRTEVVGEDGRRVDFSVKVGVKEMFDFLMYYNYHSVGGALGMLISACSGVALLMFHRSLDSLTNTILVFLFLIYIVINPIMIRVRAGKQIRSSAIFEYPMDYILGSKGFNVTQQGKELIRVPWEDVYRVRDTGNCLIIYLSRVNVYILPKDQIASKRADILQMMRENTKKGTVKVRR